MADICDVVRMFDLFCLGIVSTSMSSILPDPEKKTDRKQMDMFVVIIYDGFLKLKSKNNKKI